MLRPATPLAILLAAAFAMLLLSVLSTPIIKAIPLGTVDGYSFGVFGWCHENNKICSGIEIGYDGGAFKNQQTNGGDNFDLPVPARSTLSAILIVHPVAALFTLIMLIMAIVAHTHSASHSSRYLLVLFIFGILTFLVCLLAFLIDVLLFVPHMAWGSYIVLASTVLVALSGLVSCAMRRTIVSRKARKKRIAENAEMSGENYYNRTATQDSSSHAAAALQPTVPVISGGSGPADNKLPTFASYEKKDDRSSDERIPLTATTPSQRSPNNVPADMSAGETAYSAPSRSVSNPSLPRDQYGNPIQSSAGAAYGVRRDPSANRMNSRGRGGTPPGGMRGRGGYPGRGGYGGPGGAYGPAPPGGRGGYGPPGRGGYGPGPGPSRGAYGPRGGYGGGSMRGGRGGGPPAYAGNGGYDRRPPPPDAYGNYGPGPGRQGSPAPAVPYGANPSMPSVSTGTTGTGGYEAYNPDRVSELPRAESPPPLPGTDATSGPVGQAIEMNATTGSPSHAPPGFGQFNGIRDSDADVAGMLALQQGRMPQRHDTVMSNGSRYSQDGNQYVPPRQAWNQGPGRNSPRMPSPLHINHQAASHTPTPPPPAASESHYYEDIDPRFAEPSPPPRASPPGMDQPQHPPAEYEDVHAAAGAKSPAVSERSAFTSISQRPVNPRYQPPAGFGQQTPRRPPPQNDVNVLNSNPDFQLPTGRGNAGR